MDDKASFDLVRASVNVVLSGLLIALGTSLKLPLSTTYVAFMVAMGTSLADRAWGRESAVYRITGVLSDRWLVHYGRGCFYDLFHRRSFDLLGRYSSFGRYDWFGDLFVGS